MPPRPVKKGPGAGSEDSEGYREAAAARTPKATVKQPQNQPDANEHAVTVQELEAKKAINVEEFVEAKLEEKPAVAVATHNGSVFGGTQEGEGVAAGEEEEARRAGKEPAPKEIPECTWNKRKGILSLRQNTRNRYVPNFKPSKVPYATAGMFLHPEDAQVLKEIDDRELGEMHAHLNMGALQISRYLCEKVVLNSIQLERAMEENKKLVEVAKSFKDQAQISKWKTIALSDLLKRVRAEHQLELDMVAAKGIGETSRVNEELQKVRAELVASKRLREAVEERLSTKREEYTRNDNAQKEIIQGLKTSIQKMSTSPTKITWPAQTREQVIAEYKESDEFNFLMKDFGEYGFDLLKRHLSKKQKLAKEEVDKLIYETCIEEDSDEESDN